ncbi:MAG: magnesium transporter [Planctomycetes bacterium]|nr:magnesium transporter [Planctomycetota bacterium]
MITAYRNREGGGLEVVPDPDGREDIIWLDALSPTAAELAWLERRLDVAVPSREAMMSIELSSRLYPEGDTLVMIGSLLNAVHAVGPPLPVAFILSETVLLTVRYHELESFCETASDTAAGETALAILCRLLDAEVGNRADNLEAAMRHMEHLTSVLFASRDARAPGPDSHALDEALRRMGGMGERVASIRESIASLHRIINFVATYLPDERLGQHKEIFKGMKNDCTALSDEAGFFMNKLSFNLDATLGIINLEETKIIRILSIVTLVRSPPMLIAGVYGMNFQRMPELGWSYGYPLSVLFMTATALLPVLYMKRKRWL